MDIKTINREFKDDLDEYERWIGMEWGVNRYEDDDVFPIMSMRDDIHSTVVLHKEAISDDSMIRLRELDRRWQSLLEKKRDPNFRFNLKNFNEPKTKWWWWVDRLDELNDEEKTFI